MNKDTSQAIKHSIKYNFLLLTCSFNVCTNHVRLPLNFTEVTQPG